MCSSDLTHDVESGDPGRSEGTWSRMPLAAVRNRATQKRIVQAVFDMASWVVGLFVATLERHGQQWDRVAVRPILVMLPVAFLAQLYAGRSSGLYKGKWVFGSFEEVAAVARTVALATTVLLFVDVLPRQRPIPISAVFGGAIVTFLFQGGGRYAWRLVQEQIGRAHV